MRIFRRADEFESKNNERERRESRMHLISLVIYSFISSLLFLLRIFVFFFNLRQSKLYICVNDIKKLLLL